MSNFLQDPELTIYNAEGTVVVENQSWRSREKDISAAGLAPVDDREAAVMATLQVGSYTAIVRNQQRTEATNGVGLVEIYYLERGGVTERAP